MALKVNDSGTWKEAQEVHVNDGGTWKSADEVWVNDAGTWKQVFALQQIDYSNKRLVHIDQGQNDDNRYLNEINGTFDTSYPIGFDNIPDCAFNWKLGEYVEIDDSNSISTVFRYYSKIWQTNPDSSKGYSAGGQDEGFRAITYISTTDEMAVWNNNTNEIHIFDWNAADNSSDKSSFSSPTSSVSNLAFDPNSGNLVTFSFGDEAAYIHDGVSSNIIQTVNFSFNFNAGTVDQETGDLIVADGSNSLLKVMDGFSTTVLNSFSYETPTVPNAMAVVHGANFMTSPQIVNKRIVSRDFGQSDFNRYFQQFDGTSDPSVTVDHADTRGIGFKGGTGELVELEVRTGNTDLIHYYSDKNAGTPDFTRQYGTDGSNYQNWGGLTYVDETNEIALLLNNEVHFYDYGGSSTFSSNSSLTFSGFFSAPSAFQYDRVNGNLIFYFFNDQEVKISDGLTNTVNQTLSFGYNVNTGTVDPETGDLIVINGSANTINIYDGYSTTLLTGFAGASSTAANGITVTYDLQ